MKYTDTEVLQFVQENDVKFIRLAFCDIYGALKNIAIMAEELPRAFEYGVAFNAGMVRGFSSATHDDMVLHPDASTLEVLREIEAACRMPFTAVVNNSNLGEETTAETVLSSQDYAREVCRLSGLTLKMTTVPEQLYPELEGQIEDLFPLKLQEKIV